MCSILRGMLSDGEREQMEDGAEDIALAAAAASIPLLLWRTLQLTATVTIPIPPCIRSTTPSALVGEDRNGVIIMLSMTERDYAMFVYGEWAEYAFDRYGEKQLEGRFLSNFSDGDWYGGISNYLTACDEL